MENGNNNNITNKVFNKNGGTGLGSSSNTEIATSIDKVKDIGDKLLDKGRKGASETYEVVADKASSFIGDQKSQFTNGLSGVADTVRRVSGAISKGEPENEITDYAAHYTETVSQKLESAAQYFEKTDLRGLVRDVETYARQNPMIFIGAAFATGVLAARFIKSSPPSKSLNGNGLATPAI